MNDIKWKATLFLKANQSLPSNGTRADSLANRLYEQMPPSGGLSASLSDPRHRIAPWTHHTRARPERSVTVSPLINVSWGSCYLDLSHLCRPPQVLHASPLSSRSSGVVGAGRTSTPPLASVRPRLPPPTTLPSPPHPLIRLLRPALLLPSGVTGCPRLHRDQDPSSSC